ncbi:hypothetical protein Ancab_038163, partial [Ancistrocladus abbreviatus]
EFSHQYRGGGITISKGGRGILREHAYYIQCLAFNIHHATRLIDKALGHPLREEIFIGWKQPRAPIAKQWGVLEGLKLAWELAFQCVELELDSKIVANLIQTQ